MRGENTVVASNEQTIDDEAGVTSDVRFSSSRGFSFHPDLVTAWDPAVLQALTEHCVNGALPCNPHGYDPDAPWAGAVLDASNNLIP